MEVVVTIPNTAVNMNEMRKRRPKNGRRKPMNSERKRKSNGRRKNQPRRKPKKKCEAESYPSSTNILASLFPTKTLTTDISL
jgi:hypothetical protein